MKRYKLLALSIFVLFVVLLGCQKKISDSPQVMHWDRDMCERCKMAISERKFAVQVINPKTKKAYKFDDIGCAVLWFEEEKIPWKNEAKIWITDAKTGEWIDAKNAIYTDDSITPMAFGFGAYAKKNVPSNRHTLDFNHVVKKIFEIEKLNKNRGIR